MLKTKREIDMLQGPILPRLVAFILPLMATNLLQTFYNAADMIVVSLSSEGDAVGAIGTTGAFISMVLNLFFGFAVGANVVVARHLGSGDREAVSRAIHTSMVAAILFGLLGMGLGCAITRPVLRLIGDEGQLLELATLYSLIYFLGIPFTSITNYAISILRAMGDTRTPLWVLSGTGLLNCALNLFFVLVCRMSVDGVAWATTISAAVSAVVLWVVLMRHPDYPLSFRSLKIDPKALRSIIGIGLPAGVQGVLFSLSNMMIQSSILQINYRVAPADATFQPVVKGNSAAANIENFIYTATNSVYQAAVSFSSQNAGACRYRRIRRIQADCYLVSAVVALLCLSVVYPLQNTLFGFYGVSGGAAGTAEAIALETAHSRALILYTTYTLLAWMEVGSGILRGLGKSTTSTVVSLCGICVFRVGWICTVFRWVPTLECLYFSYPLSWLMTAGVSFVLGSLLLRRKIRAYDLREPCGAAGV